MGISTLLSERKTICMVTQESMNGVETMIKSLVKFWPADDHIIILCNRIHGSYKRFWKTKASVVRFSSLTNQDICTIIREGIKNKYLSKFLRGCVHLTRPFMVVWHIMKLKWFFEKHKVDCVFSHNGNWPGGDLNRMATIAAGLAGIEKNHMILHNPPEPKISWLVKIERLYIRRYTKKFVTVSYRKCLIPALSIAIGAPVDVIENGLDPYDI